MENGNIIGGPTPNLIFPAIKSLISHCFVSDSSFPTSKERYVSQAKDQLADVIVGVGILGS